MAARAQLKVAQDQKRLADTQLGDATTTAAKRQGRIGVNNAIAQVTNARAQREPARGPDRPGDHRGAGGRRGHGRDHRGRRRRTARVPPSSSPPGPSAPTADFAEGDLAALKVGQADAVAVDAIGATLKGTVAAIAPAASTTSGGSVVTYVVTVDLADPPADARPGMTAEVTVTTDQATGVVSVPASALRGSNGAYQVLVMGADGATQARDVTVGLVTSEAAEIKSGLTAGEIGRHRHRRRAQPDDQHAEHGVPGRWRWLPGWAVVASEQVIRP